MTKLKNIVIGIPTFRRPNSLYNLLLSIADQQINNKLHVLVADNDNKDKQGIAVVEQIRSNGFPFPITGIVVPERGISQVRNALMRIAFKNLAADGLAMLDDDEHVESYWISALLAVQERGGFDVVGGHILPDFELAPPRWTHGLTVYWRKIYKEGAISFLHRTGNVLLSRSVHEKFSGCFFNPLFGLTGGEDKEFFTRLKKKGATFGFAPEAISYEYINPTRMTRRWALRRAFQIGCSDARIFRLHKVPKRNWICELIKIPGAMAVSILLILFTASLPNRHMQGCVRLARQLGKLNGLFGTPIQTYRVIHGK